MFGGGQQTQGFGGGGFGGGATGGFGGQQQQQTQGFGGGGFGGAQQQPQGGTGAIGGLFGGSGATSGFGGGGGFGQTQAPKPGGLFGGAPAATGGFGAPQGIQGGSGFGGGMGQASTGFGGQQPSQTGFGGQQTQGFGGIGAQPQGNPGGLFGGGGQATAGFGAGAGAVQGFGGPQPATGGMFGGAAGFGQQAKPAGGGLFQQQQQQPGFGGGGMIGGQQQQQSGNKFYATPPSTQLFSIGVQFDNQPIQQDDKEGAPGMVGAAGGLNFGAGQQQPGQFGQTQGGFGAATGGFGATQGFGATAGFGAQKPQASMFGSNLSATQPGQQPGGLFGASQGMNNQQTGAFGQTTQGFGGAQPGGFGAQNPGQFGGAQQQPTAIGGLFGGAGQQPAAGGGLFGQQAQPNPAGGGLFGTAQQPTQPQGGGLFGQQPAQAAGGGGLFGQKPAGGMFGSATTPTSGAAGGGLFGGAASAQKPAGGGLFGAQPQQQAAGGGLFGAPAQPAAGGGLFGAPAQPAAGGGGLFGGQQQPAGGGGLFGAKPAAATGGGLFGAPAPAPAQGGGLFGGAQPQQPAGGGLFGAKPAAAPGGGLFGAQAPAATQGGLFGAQPQSSGGGLFGAQPAQAAGGGLFGAQPAQAAGGGLFGAPKPAGTGLFGAPAQQVAPGGGMFGQPTPGQAIVPGTSITGGFVQNYNTNQQAVNPMQQMAAFNMMASQDPYGIRGGYLDGKQATTAVDFDKEIENLQREAELLAKRPSNTIQTERWDTRSPLGDYSQPSNALANQFVGESFAEREEEERYLRKQELKFRNPHGSQWGAGQRRERSQLPYERSFNAQEGYKTYSRRRERESQNIGSSQQQEHRADHSSMKPKNHQERSMQESLHYAHSQIVDTSQRQAPLPDVIKITAILRQGQAGNQADERLEIPIHKGRDIKSVRTRIAEWLQRSHRVAEDAFQLMYKQAPLSSGSLQAAGITDDATLVIEVAAALDDTRQSRSEQINSSAQPDQGQAQASPAKEQEKPCAPSLLPTAPRDGYQTIPSYPELCQMTATQLRNVPEFSLSNEHGRIKFQVPAGHSGLDLTQVDLKNDFVIGARGVQVYEDPDTKPEAGSKLNVPSFITLFNVAPKKNSTPEATEAKLRQALQGGNDANSGGADEQAEFISYDTKTFEWQFTVPHYTRWGDDDDDEEEEESQPIQQAQLSDTDDDLGVNTKSKKAASGQPGFISTINQPNAIYKAPAPYSAPHLAPLRDNFQSQAQVAASQSIPKYGSPAYENKFGSKEKIILGNKAPLNFGNQPMAREPVKTRKMKQREEIMKNIKKKTQILVDIKNVEWQRQSNFKELQKVQKERAVAGANPQQKSNPMHLSLRGMRPCFRPVNGAVGGAGVECQLMTFHTSHPKRTAIDTSINMSLKLHHVKVQTKQFDDRTDKAPNLVPALMNNSTIQEIRGVPPREHQDQMMSNNTVTIGDNFYQKLLSETRLPLIHQKHGPSDIFRFLKDIASSYVNSIQQTTSKYYKCKLNNNFYVICMLNALFGDPRIHLAQLHPTYTQQHGVNNLNKAMKLYKNLNFSDTKKSIQTSKQRRNAVTEVLRFVCMNENYSRSTNQDAYEAAYNMLLNGDVKSATRKLSSAGDHSLAMCVSQALSGSASVKMRIASLNAMLQQKSAAQSRIVDLLSAQSDDYAAFARKQLASGQVVWQQALCSHLQFVFEPQMSLQSAITTFINDPSVSQKLGYLQGTPESLLVALLRLYVGADCSDPELAAVKLRTFNGIFISKDTSKSQEFEIQWIVQYVLRLYSQFEDETEQEMEEMADGPPFEKIGVIEMVDFDKTCCNYINQLVRQQNLEQALTISLYINNQKLKKKILFDTLSVVQKSINKENDSGALKAHHDKLKLPWQFRLSHLAVQKQYQKQFDMAVELWLTLKNYQEAHEVFMNHLACLYFGSKEAIRHLKIRRSNSSSPYGGCEGIKGGERLYIDKILGQLNRAQHQEGATIPGWEHRGGALLDFLRLLDDLEQNEAIYTHDQIVRHLFNIQSIQGILFRKPLTASIQQAISENLLETECDLKCQAARLATGGGLCPYLIAEEAISICKNQELVRRVHHQNQISLLSC